MKKDVKHRTRIIQPVRSCVSSTLQTEIESKNKVNALKKVTQNTLSVTMNSYLLLCYRVYCYFNVSYQCKGNCIICNYVYVQIRY